jgi:hypothetical protein
MKIYKKIRIDIETGAVTHEDSFEYEGPLALCGGGKGGGSTKTEYAQSPEQQAGFNALMPTYQNIGSAGARTPLGYTDKHQWHQQHRSTPAQLHKGTTCLTPLRPLKTGGTVSHLPVMAGLNAPWNDARNQMFESLGQAGSLGSAGAGMSGAAGAALGEFESNRANQMGLQAWNMMQPGLMNQWQGQLGANQYLTGMQNAAEQQQYGTNYQNQLNQQQQDYGMSQNLWNQQIAANQAPFHLAPGLMGGTYSTPIVSEQPTFMGALGRWIAGRFGAGLGAMDARLNPLQLGSLAWGRKFFGGK